jgi:hypothetical protein
MFYANEIAMKGSGLILIVIMAMCSIGVWQKVFGPIAWVQRYEQYMAAVFENPRYMLSWAADFLVPGRRSQQQFLAIFSDYIDPGANLARLVVARIIAWEQRNPASRLDATPLQLSQFILGSSEWEIVWAKPRRFGSALQQYARGKGRFAWLVPDPAWGNKAITLHWVDNTRFGFE